ncbi:PREDICTED: uncharacterized protein LOC106100709 isoform X1 [Papilio polytes]|uniref:uncharacterized protein LOC106100709 isoform X1 n=1 Tax=Papilio polytes TaxID=76194 RepID=UPI000675F474|nr:PREDICTED: uncharacterized protein LOC106100709 isoform X1 [Papilio polytes]
MQKHNCVPKLRIIIFNTYNSLPNGYVRKDTNSRKSHGFHKIRKRNILNGEFEAKFNLINLVEGLNEQYASNMNETVIANDKENKPRGELIKSKIKKIVGENGHLTLNCPEVTMESKVEWYKNNEKLNSSFRNNMAETEKEPHLTIDAYNSLYILQATKEEEGIYTCYVDGKPYQSYCVKVVSKSKLLNQEFFRYSIYLGFVLSLTITCYCAGICVAWHQRNYFADPLYLSLIC